MITPPVPAHLPHRVRWWTTAISADYSDRKDQAAALCKQYLRLKYGEMPGAVERFIGEIEGGGAAGWLEMIDIDDPFDHVLTPLEQAFEASLRE
jgi:hypothetical protein